MLLTNTPILFLCLVPPEHAHSLSLSGPSRCCQLSSPSAARQTDGVHYDSAWTGSFKASVIDARIVEESWLSGSVYYEKCRYTHRKRTVPDVTWPRNHLAWQPSTHFSFVCSSACFILLNPFEGPSLLRANDGVIASNVHPSPLLMLQRFLRVASVGVVNSRDVVPWQLVSVEGEARGRR